jgi:hypothetical protein
VAQPEADRGSHGGDHTGAELIIISWSKMLRFRLRPPQADYGGRVTEHEGKRGSLRVPSLSPRIEAVLRSVEMR